MNRYLKVSFKTTALLASLLSSNLIFGADLHTAPAGGKATTQTSTLPKNVGGPICTYPDCIYSYQTCSNVNPNQACMCGPNYKTQECVCACVGKSGTGGKARSPKSSN